MQNLHWIVEGVLMGQSVLCAAKSSRATVLSVRPKSMPTTTVRNIGMKTKAQQAAIRQLEIAHQEVIKAKERAIAVERFKLIPAMEKANEAGIPLREIGEIVGVSHVTVMRMLKLER